MALKLDNQTVVAQTATTYAPKQDALYLTVKRSKFGHLGIINPSSTNGSEQAAALAALAKIALSGKCLDISVRPAKDDTENLTLRFTVSQFVPQQRTSLAERLVTAHLNS
jgi:hypothetical protein